MQLLFFLTPITYSAQFSFINSVPVATRAAECKGHENFQKSENRKAPLCKGAFLKVKTHYHVYQQVLHCFTTASVNLLCRCIGFLFVNFLDFCFLRCFLFCWSFLFCCRNRWDRRSYCDCFNCYIIIC